MKQKPNILLFVTEQHRGDCLGIEDHPVLMTPNMDAIAGVPIPESVEGRSLLPLLRGEKTPWREHIHIEHTPMHHTLTDGKEKYIWFAADGREQFFRLTDDPTECHDLGSVPGESQRLSHWRTLLIEELKDRAEGFTDGTKLISGRQYPAVYQQNASVGKRQNRAAGHLDPKEKNQ